MSTRVARRTTDSDELRASGLRGHVDRDPCHPLAGQLCACSAVAGWEVANQPNFPIVCLFVVSSYLPRRRGDGMLG